MFDSLVYDGLEYLRHNCKEIIPSMDNNLVQSLCRLLNCYLENYTDTEFKKISDDEMKQIESSIVPVFIFCFIWSIFATVDHESRAKLNLYLRDKVKDLIEDEE